MKPPEITSLNLDSKKVIVRADLDIDCGGKNQTEIYRLEAIIPTLRYLYEKNCRIVLLGHRGRPEGKSNQELSLGPVAEVLKELLEKKWGENDAKNIKLEVKENLRFNSGEEENSEAFAAQLFSYGDFYINEAFAASHRQHASVVALPRLFRKNNAAAAGIRLIEEIKNLSTLRENVQRPFVVILGGVKDDKLAYAWDLGGIADRIMIAGRLPDSIPDYSELRVDIRFEIARLIPEKEDITINSIETFEQEISTAKTIFLAGPIGKYEDQGHRNGTKRIYEAVVKNSNAFKVAGGGDTITSIDFFNLRDKFNWLSVGGGASLEFVTKGTLPGIEALLE